MSLMCTVCRVSHGAFPKQTWKGRVMFANGILKIACEICINYFFCQEYLRRKLWLLGGGWVVRGESEIRDPLGGH